MENRKINIHQMISILVHRHRQLLPLLLNQFSYKFKSPFKIAGFFSGHASNGKENSIHTIYKIKLVFRHSFSIENSGENEYLL